MKIFPLLAPIYPHPTHTQPAPALSLLLPLDPCHLTLAERVRLFDQQQQQQQQQRDRSSNPHLLLPRPPSARRRHHHHGSSLSARFQTQPITIDEVQQASRQIGIQQQQQQQQQHRLSQQRPVSSGGSEGVAALRSIFVGRGAATTQHPTSAPEPLNSPTISLSLHTLSGGGGGVFWCGIHRPLLSLARLPKLLNSSPEKKGCRPNASRE